MSKPSLVDIFKKRTRHPSRPRSSDIIDNLFPDFKRINGMEGSLIAGSCRFMGRNLYVIGQQKPKPEVKKNE